MLDTARHPNAARSTRGCLRRLDERGDDAGFTLIEAVVSFTIFAIVTAAAVSAIVVGIKTSNGNRDRTTAANVAQQALADVQATPASSLAAASSLMTSPVGKESYTITRVITVESAAGTRTPSVVAASSASAPACPAAVVSGTAYMLHVRVTVTWPGGPPAGIAMDTVRSC